MKERTPEQLKGQSVHELIFVPCNGMDPDNLLMMVGEVNSTEASESDY